MKGAFFCLSVGLHVLVLLLFASMHAGPIAGPVRSELFHVQIVSSRDRVESDRLDTAHSTNHPDSMAVAQLSENQKKEPTSVDRSASKSTAEQAKLPEFTTPRIDVQKPPALLPLFPPDAFDASRYHRSSELSVRPAPLGNIAVPYPDGEARKTNATLKITVYIEADGSVTNVKPDVTDLPVAFAQAAQAAFMRGAFKPGQIDGRDVRSQIRVEVAFEHVPVPYRRTPAGGHPPIEN